MNHTKQFLCYVSQNLTYIQPIDFAEFLSNKLVFLQIFTKIINLRVIGNTKTTVNLRDAKMFFILSLIKLFLIYEREIRRIKNNFIFLPAHCSQMHQKVTVL